jgi:hypothetical protein
LYGKINLSFDWLYKIRKINRIKMATYEERQEKIKEAVDRLKKLSLLDENKLSRADELSPTINFSEAVPFLQEMLDIVRQLSERDLSKLTSPQLNNIISGCNAIDQLVNKINSYDLNQNTPLDICNKIVTEIKSAYDSIVERFLLSLSFTATQSTDYAKIEREAKGHRATIKEEFENFKYFIDNSTKEAENALQAVKAQAAEAGVASNAHIFKTEAENHSKLAKKWLKATIIVSIATLLAAIAALIGSFIYQPDSFPKTLQYIFSKILVLSSLSFGIFWCAKNYKSQKHNETLNNHRANALMTFKAFVEGTSDDSVRDAILLQASQAAFTCRPTGYDTQEKDIQSVNPIIEVLGKTISRASSTTET